MTEPEPYYAAREMWTGVEDNRPLWPWIVGAALVALCVGGSLALLAFGIWHG